MISISTGYHPLKFIPGEKASDLKTWLEAYRYWNMGGVRNVGSMFSLLYYDM